MEYELWASENLTVRAQDETVWLEPGGGRDGVIIGDFCGNAAAAIIDAGERWCVMVGEGLIVYRLGHPWNPYKRLPTKRSSHRYSEQPNWGFPSVDASEPSQQWWEFGRTGPKPVWFYDVRHVEGETFEVQAEPMGEGATLYQVKAERGVVRNLDWQPE